MPFSRTFLSALMASSIGLANWGIAPVLAADGPAPQAKVVWGKLISANGGPVFELSADSVLIGSDEACDVRLADKTVAPQHARISHLGGVVEVHDLGARGGTLVAGTAVKKGTPFRVLQPAELTFAAVTLHFDFGERPALIPPTQKARQPKAPAKPSKAGRATKEK